MCVVQFFINLLNSYLLHFLHIQTENFLKHKIRSRPDRAELVRMHILQGDLALKSVSESYTF